jgi:hypothetical protein
MVVFEVEKVELGHDSLTALQFTSVNIITAILHTYSFVYGTRDLL